ncbi:MAG: hypothetical protein IJ663_06925 [Spirochaetales bacterium]|nr:hypothetical protein [Spirochaetales bacterium]
MKKRRAIVAVLMLILVSSILPAAEIRSALPALHGSTAILPSDSVLGQIGDDDSCEAVSLLAKAFREPYSFEWTETYLHESVRSSLVKLFGSWFSENLPSQEMIFSVPYFNADGTVGVNVRFTLSCVAFILDGSQIVSMRIISEEH